MAYENEDGSYGTFDWYCRNKKEALKKRTWVKRKITRATTLELSVKLMEIQRNKDDIIKLLNNDY